MPLAPHRPLPHPRSAPLTKESSHVSYSESQLHHPTSLFAWRPRGRHARPRRRARPVLHAIRTAHSPASSTTSPHPASRRPLRDAWPMDPQHPPPSATSLTSPPTSTWRPPTTASTQPPSSIPTNALPDRGAHTHHITHAPAPIIVYNTSHLPANPPNPGDSGPVIIVTGHVSPHRQRRLRRPSSQRTLHPLDLRRRRLPGAVLQRRLTFTSGGATGHFGTQPIHGVVIPAPRLNDRGPAEQ